MIAHIAAISKNNCIGQDNALPWHLPEDLQHFKNLTNGRVVLMGRKTWESLPAKFRPLPNRKNIIITRQTDYSVPDGVEVYQNIDEALDARREKDIMIIGGAQIYKQTMSKADTLYITQVKQTVAGDAYYPEINPDIWKEVEREDHDGFSFLKYIKT